MVELVRVEELRELLINRLNLDEDDVEEMIAMLDIIYMDAD